MPLASQNVRLLPKAGPGALRTGLRAYIRHLSPCWFDQYDLTNKQTLEKNTKGGDHAKLEIDIYWRRPRACRGHSGDLACESGDKVVLMLNWYLYGEHAPFFYGLEKGYYSAEGIDLDIQEGRGSGITTQAVAAKSATFGYVDVPTMMRAAIKGAPVIATGVLLQKSPMSVMGFAEKNIRKPEDIKGKIVAMTPGGSNEQIWPLFLKKTGLKESDFTTVSGDPQTKVNAVINGQADLVLGYPMDQGMKILDATGKRVFPIKFADYGINLVSSGIIAHKDMLKDNPDLLRRSWPQPRRRCKTLLMIRKERWMRCLRPIRKPASRTLCLRALRKLPSST